MCQSADQPIAVTDAIATRGIHHLGLTVRDVEQTAGFFCQQLGFNRVGGKPDYPAVFISDGTIMLTLWEAKDPTTAAPFDRFNQIGLHHFALLLDDHETLLSLHQTLSQDPEVSIEFAPEALGDTPLKHMMCIIPGGLRVEFIAAPGSED